MAGAAKVAHHHAEAVVERHWNADSVVFGVPTALTNEVAVIENVAVGKCCALRQTRGARGVLDVDGIGIHQTLRTLFHFVTRDPLSALEKCIPCWVIKEDRFTNLGALFSDIGPHLPVVACLEFWRCEQHDRARLVESKLKFMGSVCRINAHHDDPDAGCCILSEHPLVTIGCPQGDTVTNGEPTCQECTGETVDFGI